MSQNFRQEFEDLLRSTQREGVEEVIAYLNEIGFFKAPASANHHLNEEGGLVEHSVNTCRAGLALLEAMKTINPELDREVKRDNIIIATLLHDVCKSDIYERTVRKRKNVLGEWEDAEGYRVTYRTMPMGHGEKSLVMLLYNTPIELTDAEMLAIRWHMGPWGINFNSREDERSYDAANSLHPLVSLTHAADLMAARIIERSPEEIDNL